MPLVCPDAAPRWLESDDARAWIVQSRQQYTPLPDIAERELLKEAIAENEREIDRRLEAIRRLVVQNHQNKARLAPIRRVPPEILSSIFLNVVGGSFTLNPSSNVQHHHILLVCKLWRNIALSTPSLWTVFNLEAGKIPFTHRVQDESGYELRLSRWLERSKSRPIDISVVGPIPVDDDIPCRLLLQHGVHWSKLRLSGILPPVVDKLFPVDEDLHCPRLSELTIESVVHYDRAEQMLDTHYSFPSLRRLTLGINSIRKAILAPGLLKLSLNDIFLKSEDVASISQSFPLLFDLRLTRLTPMFPTTEIISGFKLPALKKCFVEITGPCFDFRLFAHCPALTSLSVAGPITTFAYVTLTSVNNFTFASSHHDITSRPDLRKPFAQALPNLEEISIRQMHGNYFQTDDFLEYLTQTDMHGILPLPKLVHIKLTNCEAEESVLLALSEARCPNPDHLEEDPPDNQPTSELLISLLACYHAPQVIKANYDELSEEFENYVETNYSETDSYSDSDYDFYDNFFRNPYIF